MVVELDVKYEDQLKEIAARTGTSVKALVERAVDLVIREESSREIESMSPNRKAEMLSRMEELRKLASKTPPDDGFGNAHHDEVIYRIGS